MEALEQQKKAKEEAAATSATAPNTSAQPFTPDYAAGLMAPATPVSIIVVYLACTPFLLPFLTPVLLACKLMYWSSVLSLLLVLFWGDPVWVMGR